MSLRIEDYAIIGDCKSIALVGKNGSIDWLCMPDFNSAACFAALLGSAENGHWRIAPAQNVNAVRRRYREDSLVLESEFETASGSCRIVDCMPIATDESEVVRVVEGLHGTVEMEMKLVIRMDYGRRIPWVTSSNGGIMAVAGPDLLVLRTPVPCHGEDLTTVARFTVRAGEKVPFVLTHGLSHLAPPMPTEAQAAIQATDAFWTKWASSCNYAGPWRKAVVRSLITLKALIYAPTGGIVAAATTSLPEHLGGERNWDYRHCWLRDATFTLLSLMQAGYREEAEAWRAWLLRAAAGHPSQLQPVYTIDGSQRLDEWEVPWLGGYEGSKPVRIGNDASNQLQIDSFGEVLDALHQARQAKLESSAASWDLQRALLEHLETLLDKPDRGIWEVRGPPRYFTHSRAMLWAAFDRGISAIEDYGLDGPLQRWREIRERLHQEVCTRGVDPSRQAFIQAYDLQVADAATLLLPIIGFVPPDDPRVYATLRRVEDELMVDGLVQRYVTHGSGDGLPPGEGAFLACSFWYVDNLAMQGRRDEAIEMFERLLSLCNDVGLLAEEYDTRNRRMVGNFPQALSHLALVDSAYNLQVPDGPAEQRSRHGRGRRSQR